MVLRVCRAVVGPVDADDAWSETFLSAMKAYQELPGDASVEAWLVTIAHRKAIDVIRARARRAIPVDDLSEIASAQRVEQDDDLTDALARLPGKQQQAVAYHYLAGLPYADVAAILGGSTDAARRAAADGIAALRRAYPGVAGREVAGREAAGRELAGREGAGGKAGAGEGTGRERAGREVAGRQVTAREGETR
jgi:RNA polymerase sigma factor (sigma-70 family)